MTPIRKRLAEVQSMPWGGDRNVALRELLVAVCGDVWDTHMVDRANVVLATSSDDEMTARARVVLGGERLRRPDGTFLVRVAPSTGG